MAHTQMSELLAELVLLASDMPKWGNARVASVLTLRGHVVAYGFNSHTMHAEQMVLRRGLRTLGQRDLRKCVLWVARAKRTNSGQTLSGLARPCSHCRQLIRFAGVVQVRYTTDEGLVGVLE